MDELKKREEEWKKECDEDDRAMRQMLPWIPLMILTLIVLTPIVGLINLYEVLKKRWKIRQMDDEVLLRKLIELGLLHQKFVRRFPKTTVWLKRCAPYAKEWERRNRTTRH